MNIFYLYVFLFGCFSKTPFSERTLSLKRDRSIKKTLPTYIKESSGLAQKNGLWYTHGDSGTPPLVFKGDITTNIWDSLSMENLKNRDWEDLSIDENGAIFIADIGNNSQTRRNLGIYKMDIDNRKCIFFPFLYNDQEEFPPPKELANYDSEAFFCTADKGYFLSKNRGKGAVSLYQISLNEDSSTVTQKVVSHQKISINGYITAADLKNDRLAILSYGKVLVYKWDPIEQKISHGIARKRIPWSGQAEAICWDDDSGLWIGNEKGKLRRYKIRERHQKRTP